MLKSMLHDMRELTVKRKPSSLSDLQGQEQLLSRNPMLWFEYEMSPTASYQMLNLQSVALFGRFRKVKK
jgi:hypothetical protein